MYWDAKAVRPLDDFRIYVELQDGRKGIFDIKPYLNRGVFKELKSINYFNQVYISFGAVTWPNEQDIAPETLVSELQILEWENSQADQALLKAWGREGSHL
jgi:hypothetical protein